MYLQVDDVGKFNEDTILDSLDLREGNFSENELKHKSATEPIDNY